MKLQVKSKFRLQDKIHNQNLHRFIKKGSIVLGKHKTIREKLIISFLVPIIFIIVLGIVSYQKAAAGIGNSYENSTTQSINMSAEYLKLGAKSIESLAVQYFSDNSLNMYISGFYKNDIIKNSTLYQNYDKSLLAKASTDEFISNITILSDQVQSIGQTRLESNVLSDFYNTKLGSDLKNNVKRKAWLGSDKFLDEKLGKEYSIRYVRKFPESNAVLILDMNKKIVKKVLGDLKLNQAGKVAFITSDGKEILSEKESNNKTYFYGQEFYKDAVSSSKSSDSYYIKMNGKEYLFIYSKIGESGAMICALLSKNVIFNKADSIKSVTLFIVILACLVALLIGAFISISIDKSIRNIIAGLKKAAEGDLTVTFHSNGKDEFHTLIEQIQNTFANMKTLIQKVQVLSLEVSNSSGTVATTSDSFVKSSENISEAVNEIEQGINQQAKDAENCLNQMDKLSDKISVLNRKTEEISKITNDTKKSIEDGTKVTTGLTSQTEETMEISSEIIKEIEALAVKSSSVGKIVNVISEIANQTKLLSLNASIEAARAGEYGKGFAVVAGEIRNLAEQSSKSVSDIINIITLIEEDTRQVVTTAKKVESVMALQGNAVENTASSYQNINTNVENLVGNLDDIMEGINNIEQARISTLGAIESISAVLEEISASTNSVDQTTNNLLQTVGDLNKSAISLNSDADELVKAVDTFQI
jgi:Methyl-accepting chemotaxis protein